MSKTILLTGCAGFIGSHVARALLERGDAVIGIDNLNHYYPPALKRDRLALLAGHGRFTFFEGDIAEYAALETAIYGTKIDAVCHLAAQAGVRYSIDNPRVYIESNITGTFNVLELARHANIEKVVYASSSSVYGNSEHAPFREDQPTDAPISLYAATKKSNEAMAAAYHSLYGTKMIGLRFFTVYGPWGRPDMATFKFAKAIKEGAAIDLYNHGKMRRDFTYVDDIVAGVVASLDADLDHEVINLGGSHVTELETFVELLESAFGSKAKKNYLPLQAGDALQTSADVTKARTLLGWKPEVPLDEGLRRFAAWYSSYYA